MARSDYTIPVKVALGEGRYKFGYIRPQGPGSGGSVRILYMPGRFSSVLASKALPEPRGFDVIDDQPIARLS